MLRGTLEPLTRLAANKGPRVKEKARFALEETGRY
jgi:hypothetical protein